MIKLETHCHTGGSDCADCEIEIIVNKYVDAGYKGVVITNHYQGKYFDNYKGESEKEKKEYLISLYYEAKKAFNKHGIKTFFGLEVLANNPIDMHAEYTLFGVDDKFIMDNKPLYMLNQEELFSLCDKSGIFMYKTHPFRTREFIGEPKFMHGAEAFNGHYHHTNNNDLAEKFCEEYDLIKMSGTDFHHADQPITAGIELSENINTDKQLVECVFNREFTLIKNEKLYKEAHEKHLREKLCK